MTLMHSDYITILPRLGDSSQKLIVDNLPSTLVKDKKTLIKVLSTGSIDYDILTQQKYFSKDLLKEFLNDKNSKKLLKDYVMYYMLIYRKLYLFKTNLNFKKFSYKNNLINKVITVNFIKKERLYTKLKYSRSPAYDIVSGGAAALLAGFLGFLISEKYGFELVDSGDFYYLFMYAVFFCFSFRPLLASVHYLDSVKEIFSLKFFLNYYFFLIKFFLRK